MGKVPTALRTVILGRLQIQREHLIALTGVLDRALASSLDAHLRVMIANTRLTPSRSCVDLDPSVAVDPFDLKFGYALYDSCVGHRCYLH